MEIAVSEAKAKLSALVDAARSGERIILTRHGRPVAEIRSFPRAKAPAEKLAAMEKIAEEAKNKDTGGAPSGEADHFLYDDEGLPS